MIKMRFVFVIFLFLSALANAQNAVEPDWSHIEAETLLHYQALLKFDTSGEPYYERLAAEYLKDVLEKAGVDVQILALEPSRPNVVARLKGSGKKRPLLLMAHTDVVPVDPKKWIFPPFGAVRDSGYVYGRGSVDDKDNVVAGLMIMLTLKRLNVPLDRDVIFLAESGEESATRVGIQHVVNGHFSEIDAEYCLAEGGGVTRIGGKVKYASVQTLEKIPRAIELTAQGVSGHGSVPLKSNAIVHLAKAVAAMGTWQTPTRVNDVTRAYFTKLADISTPEEAARYRDAIGADLQKAQVAIDYFAEHEPRHAAMLRTSVSPNVISGGYRFNVIPSEAKATLDVRLLPDEDPASFLASVKKIVNDQSVEAAFASRDVRPGSAHGQLDSDAFKAIEKAVAKNYQTVTLPTMSTGATDMAYLRAKGIACYGIGPATDFEDGPKGFGAHSDQERILESELHRFVHFEWDVVKDLAGKF